MRQGPMQVSRDVFLRSGGELSKWRRVLLIFALAIACSCPPVFAQTSPTSGNNATSIAKSLGSVKSIQGESVTIITENGEVIASISSATKILRVPPGEKDLKNAVPLQLHDLQPGDRVLVRGTQSADANSISALAVIVMRQTDVTAKQDQQRAEWQKRGVGGLVTSVDLTTNVITISSSAIGKKQSIAVHIGQDTILRRYAPGSVKFDDAKPMPTTQFMAEVKAGDQLRARGTKSADGAEVTAHEIVAGSFRNIAGTIQSIDGPNYAITVRDLISKTNVVVSLSADSQIKKLTPEVAQRIATRLKMPGPADSAPNSAATQTQVQPTPRDQYPSAAGGSQESPRAGAYGADVNNSAGGNGPPDLQRLLSRLPASSISDLKAGDAVMMVATEAAGASKATAITLLAGVEPILTAAPSRNTSSLLSPWSLSMGETDTQ